MISIIIISKNEGFMLKQTVDSILAAACQEKYELIVVDDASVDDSSRFLEEDLAYSRVMLLKTAARGIAAARNAGALAAKGDYLVFCDAHILVQDRWLDILQTEIKACHAQAACPAIAELERCYLPKDARNFLSVAASQKQMPAGCGKRFRSLTESGYIYSVSEVINVPVISGPCTMVERKAFEEVKRFGEGFYGYGWEEEELGMKLWMFGHRIIGVPATTVKHWFRQSAPYAIKSEEFYHNLLYMGYCLFNKERMAKLLETLSFLPERDLLYHLIIENKEYQTTKAYLQAERKWDDDWYFEHINI